MAQLQEELTSTENKIGFARQHYNDVATQYNTRQATFPTMLVAGLGQRKQPAERLGQLALGLGGLLHAAWRSRPCSAPR